jgi:alkylhydroperoxidase family enzyme
VAHLAVSPYEWTQHVPIAESFGASPQLVTAIEAGEGDAVDSSEQRAVLSFTREVILDGAASEQAVATIRQMLGERGVIELLLVIGNYMGLARLIATVGLEPHEPVVRLPGGTDALGPR